MKRTGADYIACSARSKPRFASDVETSDGGGGAGAGALCDPVLRASMTNVTPPHTLLSPRRKNTEDLKAVLFAETFLGAASTVCANPGEHIDMECLQIGQSLSLSLASHLVCQATEAREGSTVGVDLHEMKILELVFPSG